METHMLGVLIGLALVSFTGLLAIAGFLLSQRQKKHTPQKTQQPLSEYKRSIRFDNYIKHMVEQNPHIERDRDYKNLQLELKAHAQTLFEEYQKKEAQNDHMDKPRKEAAKGRSKNGKDGRTEKPTDNKKAEKGRTSKQPHRKGNRSDDKQAMSEIQADKKNLTQRRAGQEIQQISTAHGKKGRTYKKP